MAFTKEAILRHLGGAYQDPSYFNEIFLGRGSYWTKQEAICRSVVKNKITVCPAANSVGKTHVLAGLALWYLSTRKDSMVVTTASTAAQLRLGLWANIRKAHGESRIPLGGKITGSPHEQLMMADKWFAVGLTSSNVEALSGFHPSTGDLLVIIDEGSGVADEAYEALFSLNPRRIVIAGNPLRPDGQFYELCRKAAAGQPDMGYVQIASTDSPDIGLDASPRGLADGAFIHTAEVAWGRDTPLWMAHVEGKFPESSEDSLIQASWLDLCDCPHVRSGPVRIGIDYAEGSGGDESCICVRDDNGILVLEGSNRWDAGVLAKRVADHMRSHSVLPGHITWDATGTGSAFGNSLRAAGVVGARAYKGAIGTPKRAVGFNLRSQVAWRLRLRLDPHRVVGDLPRPGVSPTKQATFSIPGPILTALRPEIQALRYSLVGQGKIKLESKQELKAKIGRSPDRLDALLVSFHMA